MQQVEYVTHSNAFAWVREIQHPAVRLASKSTVRGGDEILSLGEFPRAFTSTYVEVELERPIFEVFIPVDVKEQTLTMVNAGCVSRKKFCGRSSAR